MSADVRAVVSYVVNSLNPGGTERLVMDMSRALSDEFGIEVVCLDTPGAWAAELRSSGVPVRALWRQPGLDVSMALKLARHFRRVGTRIIHAHQCTPWFYGALSRLLFRRPRLLLEEHGRFFPEAESPLRVLANRALVSRLTDRFVAVSQDVARRLQRFEGLDLQRIEVVYNGVAEIEPLGAPERRSLREELGFGDEEFIVGTVGRFDEIKNLPMLVQSLAAACSRVPRVRGLLVGDGPVFDAVRSQVAQAGLEERVRLTGYRSDARRLVQCLDLFVLSSFSEGTSMALLEAMSSGLPVAVTAVGGNPEIVSHGETGWLVPSGDGGLLSQVLVEAATDPEKCARLGRAGRCKVVERFTFPRMLQAYRECYRALLQVDE